MTEIRFSPDAVNNLVQTKAYIADELGNEQAAVRVISKIAKQIEMLREFPMSGAPLSSVINIDTDYRYLVCGSYTAFYRVEGNTVSIIRVLYGRRNFMQILFRIPDSEF